MILVVAEQQDGKLNRATWEAVAAAQQLAGKMPITIAVLGVNDSVPMELAACRVAEVLSVQHEAFALYTPDAWTVALMSVIESVSPQIVLLPHTYQARDFAPMLAARLRKPLLTDVTGFSGIGNQAIFTRPMFQGKLVASVKPVGDPPWFVTLQLGAFAGTGVQRDGSAQVRKVDVAMHASAIRQQVESPFQEARTTIDLSQAERIVAVGRGIKSRDNLSVVERLAKALDAEIAASRPICDSGWLPMERQIGSSGQTVAPKLYLALGISGAIQHVVGMKGSRTIVAINKDVDAPIFEVADFGIVGDLLEIAPAIVAEIESR